MEKSWRTLEQFVRQVASTLWHQPALAERIDGVNFDAVIRISDEEIILIEITEEYNLEKIRSDVAKILAVKMRLASESTVARAYIVLKDEPTPGMAEIGQRNKIQVLSAETFARQVLDFETYRTKRIESTFGSAIDPITGKSDVNSYVPVTYLTSGAHKDLTVKEVGDRLIRGSRIVLLGEYGTGKSRCVKEAFSIIAGRYREASAYPIAVNLREHWGAQSGVEIVAGHLQRLGLSGSIDRFMQLLQSGNILLLLDGFDEVGVQTFGNSEDRRASIRRQALNGVRDLISLSSGGVLITGRPHYFEDNQELLEAVGLTLRNEKTEVILCREEFTETQANLYLSALKLSTTVPKWLPRKPLMFQVLASIDPADAEEILKSKAGELGFWGQFIDTVCVREAKMHPSIEASTVRSVLGALARLTRTGGRQLGRLTPKDINQAYETSTGHSPDEAGQLMLSRLCTLGRIEPESPDRQFVDPYIVQLLFAECIVDDISTKNFDVLGLSYIQALEPIGLVFLAEWLETYAFEAEAFSLLHRDGAAKNRQILGEIVAALLLIEGEPLDFSGLQINGAEICILSLGNRAAKNIQIVDGDIHLLEMQNCLIENSSNFQIKGMDINRATGLSSVKALPQWFENCRIREADSVSNSSRIKTSRLPAAQKLFLSIIHKIFFQRGGGRKENSLYKGGFGQGYDKKLIDKILAILVSSGIIEKSRDTSGSIYNPKREYTSRMKAIRDQLTLSKDPLWLEMEKLT